MATVVHGRNLIIKMNGTAIAGAKSCEISVKCDKIETASPSTGTWRTFLAGRKEWSVSCGHLITASGTPLKSRAQMVGQTVTLTMQTDMPGDTISGSAIVEQWSASGAVGSLANGKFSFCGSGPLS